MRLATQAQAFPSEFFKVGKIEVEEAPEAVVPVEVNGQTSDPLSVLSNGLHGRLKVLERAVSGAEYPMVEVNRDVEWCALRVCDLPGQEIRVLASEMNIRPRPAMAEQDGPPKTADVNQRHEVLESRRGVYVFRRSYEQVECGGEYLWR